MDRRDFLLLTTISGFLLFVALLCLGILFVVNWRGFYHLLVTPLNIMSDSALPKEIILRNYDCLIDYCSPFYRGGLTFPDFPSSVCALSHFAETKVLFSRLYLAVPCCFLLAAILTGFKVWEGQEKRKTAGRGRDIYRHSLPDELSRTLRLAAWLCFLFPAACLLLFLADFHDAFYRMHHIFFRNNDWLFDAATDPVITILPERYFLCCGVFIAVFLILAAVGLTILYRRLAAASPRGRVYRKEGRHKGRRRAGVPT